ncbi:MAG TPA: nucleoside monophosphate kinase [Candidatus Paceibacterota bacterium]|nr:nucleoside monophosphate kinase [Candidatus Paceibacterota bacterium]
MDILQKYKAFAMLGKPGSGKGTQSALLSKVTGYDTYSSGQRFRDLAAEGGPLGERIGNVLDNGGLMPYWFASFVFEEKALYTHSDKGIIFDGVARKAPEAELFHDVMTWLGRPYVAFYIDVSDEEAIHRLLKRKDIQHRKDDEEAAIKTRFDNFQKEVLPAVEIFRKHGTLLEVNGEQSAEQVFEEIIEKLGSQV